jgi:TonB family protein
MALTGQLNDLSLAELIEFFCNQRKTGRLNVAYKRGTGVFYIESGELVDAQIGKLRGVEAVYFALTLPNASFGFASGERAAERTIRESWAQVILEGLRRFDERQLMREEDVFTGESAANLAPLPDVKKKDEENKKKDEDSKAASAASDALFAQVAETHAASGKNRAMFIGGVAVVLIGVTAFGAITSWNWRGKAVKNVDASANISLPVNNSNGADNSSHANTSSPVSSSDASNDNSSATNENDGANNANSAQSSEAAAAALRREREMRERQRLEQQRLEQQRAMMSNQSAPAPTPAPSAPPAAPKSGQTVTVRVTVDAEGHVTQASVANPRPGMEAYEAAALRAARNRRFPAGQAGMQSVSIKIN